MSQLFGGLPFLGPIQVGQTASVFKAQNLPVGTHKKVVILGGDTCLLSLYAESITGTLEVTVSTAVEVGKEFEIITFPILTAATTDLILKKASIAMGVVIVCVTVTGGPASFDLDIRALATADGNTRTFRANKSPTTSTPAVLTPASNRDRQGLTLKNNSTAGVLYIGFDLADTTTAQGYPVYVGADFQFDLAAGQTIYAVTNGPSIDVRVAEAFS